LYTISVLKNNHVFPIVYAVLKNKKQSTYYNLFEILKLMIPNIAPRVIKTDFEFAAISALRISFPQAQISGCQFHLAQANIEKYNHLDLHRFIE
jgi:hypothetical protein